MGHDALVRLATGQEAGKSFVRLHCLSAGPGLEAGHYEIDLRPAALRRAEAQPALPPRLEVRRLRFTGGPRTDLSFRLNWGEIVGLAGRPGSGRRALAETLFGLRRVVSGEVLLDGHAVSLTTPAEAIAAGLMLVPGQSRPEGLVLAESVQRNLSLPNLELVSVLGLLSSGRERAQVRSLGDRLGLPPPRRRQILGGLSGGDRQKVALGRWLVRKPRVLLLDEPTQGLDVEARRTIHGLLDELAGQGLALLVISNDLEELRVLSDRVLVWWEGHLAGQLKRDDATEDNIVRLAYGGKSGRSP
jgi:ribose transport system ATP-binding protein